MRSGSSLRPLSSNCFQAEVMGRITASVFLTDLNLLSGKRLPRKSNIYLSILDGMHDVRSGRGCSLNRESRSSLVRQHFMCFSTYHRMACGTLTVPSLASTRAAGSKHGKESSGSSIHLLLFLRTDFRWHLGRCDPSKQMDLSSSTFCSDPE